jgi:hypothetical protein
VLGLAVDLSFEKLEGQLRAWLPAAGTISAETARRLAERHGRRLERSAADPDPDTRAAFAKTARDFELFVDAGKVNTIEERWKDLKFAVFGIRPPGPPSTDWRSRRLPELTPRLIVTAIEAVDRFRQRLRPLLAQLGLRETKDLHVLGDGAAWIWRAVEATLRGCRETLDVFHALERIGLTARELHGEGTEAATACFDRGAKLLLDEGYGGVQRLVAEQLAEAERLGRRPALDRMMRYFAMHGHRLDYPGLLAEGLSIGSGPVEGVAKTMKTRLAARGARWRTANVTAMAALIAARESTGGLAPRLEHLRLAC